MENEKSHWHWEQGTKYAVEGIKTTLLLNGAAAIALMTFATANEFSFLLMLPLLSFVGGAALSAFAFFAAYKTQLEYGNAHRHAADTAQHQEKWKQGEFWNRVALSVMLASVVVHCWNYIGRLKRALSAGIALSIPRSMPSMGKFRSTRIASARASGVSSISTMTGAATLRSSPVLQPRGERETITTQVWSS